MSQSAYTNITKDADFSREMSRAFSEIRDIFYGHCGPYAGTAIVGVSNRMADGIDVFTKDGVTIARTMLADKAPIHRFAARLTRFLGTQTDKKCHDGTTTTMALFAGIVSEYFKYRNEQCSGRVDYREADTGNAVDLVKARHRDVQTMREIIAYLKEVVHKNKLTVADLHALFVKNGVDVLEKDVHRAVAYQTALISSKGDIELATAIADVIAATPIDMHGLFVKALAPNEKAKRVSVVKRDYQFELNCSIGIDVLNTDMRQALVCKNAVLMASTRKLADKSWDEDILFKMLNPNPAAKDLHELESWNLAPWWDAHDNRTLILFVPQVNSYRLSDAIEKFNVNHPANPVVIAQSSIESSLMPFVVSCLYALRDRPLPEDIEPEHSNLLFIEGLDIAYRKGSMKINGLYTPTDDALNPMFLNPESAPHYTATRETCDRLIKLHVDDPNLSGMSSIGINIAIYFYRFLTCQTILDVQLGGLLHGNKELQSVHEDAMGSALSACNYGVICDTYTKLLAGLSDDELDWETIPHKVWKYSLESLIQAIHRVRSEDDHLLIDPDPEDFYICQPDIRTSRWDSLNNPETIARFLDPKTPTPAALIQPILGAEEQLLRIGDILPGVMNTTLFIDMGHMENNDDDRNNNA